MGALCCKYDNEIAANEHGVLPLPLRRTVRVSASASFESTLTMTVKAPQASQMYSAPKNGISKLCDYPSDLI